MKKLLKFSLFLVFAIMIIISCKKEKEVNHIVPQANDTLQIVSVKDFIHNIPIHGDSILMDYHYGIDFRVDLEGYKIDSVKILLDNTWFLKFDTTIINSKVFYYSPGVYPIKFILRVVKIDNGQTTYLKSNQLVLKVVENLSPNFINISDQDGRLNISWPELDKKNTDHYLIERYMGENLEFMQAFDEGDSTFTDNYYVGEDVVYKISVINKQGGRQNVWRYHKEKEEPKFSITQDLTNGYILHYDRCRYYNNFKQYYLTDGSNSVPVFLYSSTNIADTSYHDADAIFGDEARYWIRFLPKAFPAGVTADNWQLYAHFLYSSFGERSFEYERIAKINNQKVVYTKNGNIYKRNIETDLMMDSIMGGSDQYGFLRTTPNGSHLYAVKDNIYGSPVYFWDSDQMTNPPLYTFQTQFYVPPVSDNLIAIMSIPSSVIPSKLALYDVTNGSRIFTTPYDGTSNGPTISSNGQYFFINSSGLKLCKFVNGTYSLIWEETNWIKYYQFYDFNANNNGICYVWDDEKNFSVRNTSDFSNITSYTLNVDGIINIDYNTNRLMGCISGNIVIYDLTNGTLIKEIPAKISNLFLYSNNTILIGNTIYSNMGIKYKL